MIPGSLSVSVSDQCFVTCAKTRLKAILFYQEEGWVGKAQNRMQGVIFNYDPDNDKITKIRDVPEADIVGRVEGCWHEQIYFSRGSKPMDKAVSVIAVQRPIDANLCSMQDRQLVVDLNPLWPEPKLIPPVDDQLPNESRKMWEHVTSAIIAKQWSAATAAKQDIEERQRAKAADRKARNVEWKPRFFTGAVTPAGKPELTDDGWDLVKRMHEDDYKLTPSVETAV